MRSQLWPAYKKRLQYSTLPILCGPWRGEVGFEALYWIPFLRRFAKRCNIDPARLIPITRGGAGAWYGFADGVELYSLITPQDMRVENRIQHTKTAMLKQIQWTALDRQVIKDAAKRLNLTRYHALHPAWMFARLRRYFNSAMSLTELEHDCFFDPLTPAPLPAGIQLPDRYVAVRFYLRHTYPGSPALVQFAQESIRTMAQHTPVVLLTNDVHADEHFDIRMPPTPNVHQLTDLCPVTPANNLAVQSAVLAKALGFVGTYGGLAQLALRIGKPSVSYYNEWAGTAMAHKHLADAIALQSNLPCIVQKVGELPLLQSVAPVVEMVPA